VVSHKTATSWAARLPVSPPVLWTGIAVGVFLAVEAMVHGTILPLALGAITDAAITFLFIVAVAVVLAELGRRHHRTVLRHGGRLSASGFRRVRRHGSGVLAWLAAKAGPIFRRARQAARSPAPRDKEGERVIAALPGDGGDCIHCGRALSGEHDGWAHKRCQEVVKADDSANEIHDNGPLEKVERKLRQRGKCPYQIKSGDWDGSAIYCGRAIIGDEDDFCPQHQHEADGDDEGAAGELNHYVRGLLENEGSQSPTEGSTTMPASRISTGHRARRAARSGDATVPSEWAPVIAQTADFEPEDDGELLEWMSRQLTGLSGWAEALVDFYEHATSVIGIDPQASAMLHDVADAAAQAAEAMGAAKAKFTEHYELPREFAATGGLMPHDGRWITGEGA
jgi:hypothetical protein